MDHLLPRQLYSESCSLSRRIPNVTVTVVGSRGYPLGRPIIQQKYGNVTVAVDVCWTIKSTAGILFSALGYSKKPSLSPMKYSTRCCDSVLAMKPIPRRPLQRFSCRWHAVVQPVGTWRIR